MENKSKQLAHNLFKEGGPHPVKVLLDIAIQKKKERKEIEENFKKKKEGVGKII